MLTSFAEASQKMKGRRGKGRAKAEHQTADRAGETSLVLIPTQHTCRIKHEQLGQTPGGHMESWEQGKCGVRQQIHVHQPSGANDGMRSRFGIRMICSS